MKKYMLKTDEMNKIMELLFHVLDMRVTFFDIDEEELHDFTIKDMSLFCKQMRQDQMPAWKRYPAEWYGLATRVLLCPRAAPPVPPPK